MRILVREELVELATKIVRDMGSQAEAARRLEVTPAAVSNALRQAQSTGSKYDVLLCRIVRELGEMPIEGETIFRLG